MLAPSTRRAMLLAFVCTSVLALSARKPKTEIVSGRIVAHDQALTCLNGNGYWSMLIEVQQSKTIKSKFVRVDFSLPCSEDPKWPAGEPPVQQFRLLRDDELRDPAVKEFMECIEKSPDGSSRKPCPQMRVWKLMPGVELDKMPFGQRVPCYRSLDLPLAPVL